MHGHHGLAPTVTVLALCFRNVAQFHVYGIFRHPDRGLLFPRPELHRCYSKGCNRVYSIDIENRDSIGRERLSNTVMRTVLKNRVDKIVNGSQIGS